jgi:hypothetical protein
LDLLGFIRPNRDFSTGYGESKQEKSLRPEPAGQTLSGGVFGEFGNNSTSFGFREENVGLL